MKKDSRKLVPVSNRSAVKGYDAVLSDVVDLLESARRTSVRTINTIMTATYWEIGRKIVDHEQEGKDRATYGKELLQRLGADLTAKFGRGFGWRNLYQMRSFYLAYPRILQTPSAKSESANNSQICQAVPGKLLFEKCQTTSGQLDNKNQAQIFQTPSGIFDMSLLTKRFPLPWSHYVCLLSVRNPDARFFYETEALRNGWSVRQLERQISTQFYERTALSKNKAAMLKKGAKPITADSVTPEEEIKDPFVLEFLGLKDEYSENDLEEALIHKLETFLLELGGDFAFIGRQRRLRIGDEWYRVDLVFFHRRLRCLVIIDLKLGKFTHADAGQMHLYLNYAKEHWAHAGENPPVGLILCAQKDSAVAHYALEGLPNKVLAAEYRTALPDEKILAAELERTRKILERHKMVESGKKVER